MRGEAGLFDDVVLGAVTNRPHGVGDGLIRRHHHQRGVRLVGEELRDDANAVVIRQAMIEQNHAILLVLNHAERLAAGVREIAGDALTADLAPDGLGVKILVVDYQGAEGLTHAAPSIERRRVGSTTVAWHPPP